MQVPSPILTGNFLSNGNSPSKTGQGYSVKQNNCKILSECSTSEVNNDLFLMSRCCKRQRKCVIRENCSQKFKRDQKLRLTQMEQHQVSIDLHHKYLKAPQRVDDASHNKSTGNKKRSLDIESTLFYFFSEETKIVTC